MNKIAQKLKALFIIVLACLAAGQNMYVASHKGTLLDKSVILYMLVHVISWYITLIFFLFTLFYAVEKYLKTRNILYGLPGLVVVLSILTSIIFFKEINEEQLNYNIYHDKRMIIIENIEQGIWRTHETAEIELPHEYKEEQEEGLGYVYLVRTNKGKGVYFCVSSFVDTSSGYVYLTDDLPDDSKYMVDRVILFKEYDTRWYSCSTDY